MEQKNGGDDKIKNPLEQKSDGDDKGSEKLNKPSQLHRFNQNPLPSLVATPNIEKIPEINYEPQELDFKSIISPVSPKITSPIIMSKESATSILYPFSKKHQKPFASPLKYQESLAPLESPKSPLNDSSSIPSSNSKEIKIKNNYFNSLSSSSTDSDTYQKEISSNLTLNKH